MRKRYWIASIVVLLLVLMSAINVLATDGTVMDWWVVASGGGPSSSGSVTMNSTLGQPLVGQSSGGSVSLSAGYWTTIVEYITNLPLVLRNCSP